MMSKSGPTNLEAPPPMSWGGCLARISIPVFALACLVGAIALWNTRTLHVRLVIPDNYVGVISINFSEHGVPQYRKDGRIHIVIPAHGNCELEAPNWIGHPLDIVCIDAKGNPIDRVVNLKSAGRPIRPEGRYVEFTGTLSDNDTVGIVVGTSAERETAIAKKIEESARTVP